MRSDLSKVEETHFSSISLEAYYYFPDRVQHRAPLLFSHTMNPIAFLLFSPPESEWPFGNIDQIRSLSGEVIMSVPAGRGSLDPKNTAVES